MKKRPEGKTLAEMGFHFAPGVVENYRIPKDAQGIVDGLNANVIADQKKKMKRGNKKPQPPRP